MTTLKNPVSASDHAQGSQEAPLTLVEYGDYQCPHCRVAHAIVKRIQAKLGERLRFIFRNFPLTEAHPEAGLAAEAAEFAGAHGKFWEMHHALFDNQESLGPDLYMMLATKLGLDPKSLVRDLEIGTYREKVKADFLGGVRSGVNGTPTFYINGNRHDEAYEYSVLLAALESARGVH